MEFKKYQHVCRYGTDETDGILKGVCAIMPKIDGTNASVWIENGEICCGSRTRELELGKDNAGFMSFVMGGLGEPIRKYLENNPTHRLYGEWLVPHTIRDYKDDAWRKFYVFDVMYVDEYGIEHYIEPHVWAEAMIAYGIDFIPVVAYIENPTMDELKFFVAHNHFLMQDGCIGEGIVIKNYGYANKYGRITWAKIINDEFKDGMKTKAKAMALKDTDLEQAIAVRYCTNSLIHKERAKIMNETPDIERKILIPKLIEMVFRSVIVEDMYDICKQYKCPTISFKALRNECIKRIKEVEVDLFI